MNELADLLLKVPGEAWLGAGVVALIAAALGWRRRAKDASAHAKAARRVVRSGRQREDAEREAEERRAGQDAEADREHADTSARLRDEERRIDTATPDALVDEINRTFGGKP